MSNQTLKIYFLIILFTCASFATIEGLFSRGCHLSAQTGPGLKDCGDLRISSYEGEGSLPTRNTQPATRNHSRDHKRPLKKAQPKIAILPFENLSGQFGASEQVMADIMGPLQKEFSIVPEGHLEIILTELRVRHTGFLTTGQINEIGKLLKVDTILFGIIDTYRQKPLPQVSFLCNLVSTKGSAPILWSKYFSAVGQQKAYLLQRDNNTTWSSIMQSVTEDLLYSLPKSKER